jgi:hypothetical protein
MASLGQSIGLKCNEGTILQIFISSSQESHSLREIPTSSCWNACQSLLRHPVNITGCCVENHFERLRNPSIISGLFLNLKWRPFLHLLLPSSVPSQISQCSQSI